MDNSNDQSMFSRIAYGVISSITIFYIVGQIMTFFGIGFDVYGIYVLYLIALSLMYGFLPKDVGGMFN